MIRYLRNQEIDRISWDTAIKNSANSLIYAQSWFLDIVSPGWEALIEGDYEFVMPLPVKKRMYLFYLIQPKFTQQLGVFSGKKVTSEKIEFFIRSIPSRFVWRDFNLNQQNICNDSGLFSQRINYELDLNRSYSLICKNYHENTRRNLVKAKNPGHNIQYAGSIWEFLIGYEKFSMIKQPPDAINQLKRLITQSLELNAGKILIGYDSNNQMVAGAFFLAWNKRIIYLTSFSNQKGKESAVMFGIMDRIIREYADQSYILDFEGSMHPGIARFFEGFGANVTTYYRYQYSFIKKLRLTQYL